MPKWTEYISKDTLTDNDEVMLYDATAKANKRGLMSKFWDYVVDKMATAVISKLETDNKTIIGAINALNGKSLYENVIHSKVEDHKYIGGDGYILSYNPYSIVYVPVSNAKTILFTNLSDNSGTRHELWNSTENKLVSFAVANKNGTYKVSVPNDNALYYVKLSTYNENGLPKIKIL